LGLEWDEGFEWEWVFAIWLNTHIISVLSVVVAMTVMLVHSNDGLLVLPGQLDERMSEDIKRIDGLKIC